MDLEASDNEQFITFAVTRVHDTMQQNIASNEEIHESIEDCVLQDELTEICVNNVDDDISEGQVTVEILAERSDEDGENSVAYPIYIKEEEQQQYTSGDDESMAVEALRQLGGMYPCFEDKKISCSTCTYFFSQSEISKHQESCRLSAKKFNCSTCGEKFERKIDLNNHIVCHQVDRPHACRICGNLFRSKINLQTHMSQAHRMEKPHKCTVCSADFQRSSSLSNHMKIHTYIAGRAISQNSESNTSQIADSFKKWPEVNTSESQNMSSSSSSSVSTIQSYDITSVQWPASYTLQNDQTNVTLVNSSDKINSSLPEFTVMLNGEVASFDYAQISSNQIPQQYNLNMNSFENPNSLVKIETLSSAEENQINFVNTETKDTKSYTCKQCGVNFSQATALKVHEKIHAPKTWIMPIECEYCDKQFQDSNHLASHQTTCAKKLMQNNSDQGALNNKWGKHVCSECGKKFTTKQKMFRHQWIHRKKTHSCEVCGTQFEKQIQLDGHRLAAHPGDSPFTCNECGKSFVSRQGLWEHGRTHAGSPAHFHCDTCSKTFSSRQGYLIHHRTHTGERPYGCKFCWKAFRDGGTLRKHERIHTGERPHVCPLCSRAFNQKVVLREHVRWVHAASKNESETTGPPFPCPLCGTLNQDRDELCAHIVKHSDKMIAEAKAKINSNGSKAKPVKKKEKTESIQVKQGKLNAQDDQTDTLISIVEGEKGVKGHIINTKQGDTLLLVTSDKDLMSDVNGEHNGINDTRFHKTESLNLIAVEKKDNTTFLVPAEQETIIHSITNKHSDLGTLFIPSTKNSETFHLISNHKQDNTIHLLTKQNESLPILTIPNSNNFNFSSENNTEIQIDISDTDSLRQNLVLDQANSSSPLIGHYEQQDSDNDDDELICGICGDEFGDKNILMEHVKVHI
ncbi:zinc finger protein 271-like [Chelonus insularis]|uniref:zinc finger protein 271-like n=1 Tax=Chelonus insularis TaxID=460826 RepID=UPI00158D2AB9|nr:zinc finger protein 271-like [Chelonus insularis]